MNEKIASFENKLVAILNKTLEPGVALNALAHMTLGLGASVEKSALCFDDYTDAQGNAYPHISQIPFIVLRGTSGEIRKAVFAARAEEVAYGVFLNTMTGGTYLEQLQNTHISNEESLIYYGCVLFGPWDQVSAMTKKFSLWR